MSEQPEPIDLTTSQNISNPYAVYERLRAQQPACPVARRRGTPSWLITRYDHVRRGITEPSLCNHPDAGTDIPGPHRFPLSRHMLACDPPDHTRLRKLVSWAFTPRRINALVPGIEKLIEDLLNELPADEPVDLAARFAYPMSLSVICGLLGVPTGDEDDLRRWTLAILSSPSDATDELMDNARALRAYLTSLIEAKRRTPDDGLISHLTAAHDTGGELDFEELVSSVFQLLTAGYESTATTVCHAVLALLDAPDQRAKFLVAEGEELEAAVEELLRFTSTIQLLAQRRASAPMVFEDTIVAPGDSVLLAIGSANHDERVFPQPDRLDLTRDSSAHLSLGHGRHFCLGAVLARIELRVALRELFRHYPGLSLAVPRDSVQWRAGLAFHGPVALPLLLTPDGTPPRKPARPDTEEARS